MLYFYTVIDITLLVTVLSVTPHLISAIQHHPVIVLAFLVAYWSIKKVNWLEIH